MGLFQDILSVALEIVGKQFDHMAQTAETKLDDYQKEASNRGYSFSAEQNDKINNAKKIIHNYEVYGKTFENVSEHVGSAKNFHQGYTNVKRDLATGNKALNKSYVNYSNQKNQKSAQQKVDDEFQERLNSGYYEIDNWDDFPRT